MTKALFACCFCFLLTATVAAGADPAVSAVSDADANDELLPDQGTTHLATELVRIKLDPESPRPMIELRVNGKGPYRFVVDTGSPLTVLDAGIAEELGLEVVGTQVLHSPGASEDIQGKRVRADRIEVGGLSIERPVLATMDLVGFSAGTIEGVLGRSHFSGLLLTFDFPAFSLAVAQGSLDRSDPAVVAINPDAASIQFPVDIAGVSVPMVLDTGSPGAFSVPKAYESRLSFRGAIETGPTIRLVGGAHSTWRATLDGDVRFGGLDYSSPEVLLTTISDEFGNIGNGVLRDLRVTLDLANHLVRFERVAPSEAGSGAGTGSERIVRRQGPVRLGGRSETPRLGVGFEMTPGGFIKKQGGIVVRHLDAASPAESAGLEVGDIVTAVAGQSLENLGLREIGALLRGPRPVALQLLRGEERLEITIE